MIPRCDWCCGFLWPWQKQTNHLHQRCADAVQRIWEEDQRRMSEDAHFHGPEWMRHSATSDEWHRQQAELRWKQEDEL